MTIVAMLLAAIATYFMSSVAAAWAYILTFTAGVGLVMILRWYWWRINAWTEIAALLTSGVVASALQIAHIVPEGPTQTPVILLLTVAITSVVWLAVTFLTKPEPMETLENFYRKVRPSAAGWGPVAARVPDDGSRIPLGLGILDWLAGCGLVFCSLFGIGKVVLGELSSGVALLTVALACLAFILWDMNRRNWETVQVEGRHTGILPNIKPAWQRPSWRHREL